MLDAEKTARLLAAAEAGDIDGLLLLIGELKYREDIERAAIVLTNFDQAKFNAALQYALAQLDFRLGRFTESKDGFLRSAQMGLFSGFYRAGKIYEDGHLLVESGHPEIYLDLFERASDLGHVWAKLAVLQIKSRASISSRFKLYLLRFISGPVVVLLSMASADYRERVRF